MRRTRFDKFILSLKWCFLIEFPGQAGATQPLNSAGAAIPAGAGTAPASPRSTDGGAAALGVEDRQFALHMFAPAFVTFDILISLVKGAQDFVFFLAIEADVFVDWHNAPSTFIIYHSRVNE